MSYQQGTQLPDQRDPSRYISRMGPILTDGMVRVIQALREASEPLSARQVAKRLDDDGHERHLEGYRADAARNRLTELVACGWVHRDHSGVRRSRSDPLFVFALTAYGRERAEADLGPLASAETA